MLIELACLELRKTAYTFWLFADGLIFLMLGIDCLSIFAGMFLYKAFESHWWLPLDFHEGIFLVVYTRCHSDERIVSLVNKCFQGMS